MNKFFAAIFLLFALNAHAKTFRIAAMYPVMPVGSIDRSSGLEAACITKAAVKEAQKSGLDVSLDPYVIDRTVFSAVQIANTVASKKYDAAVGTLVSLDAMPVSDIFENAKIPFITPTATNPYVTAGKTFALRIPFNDYRQSKLLARLAVTEFNPKRITVVRNASSPYSIFLATQFTKEVRALNKSVVITDFQVIEGFNGFRELTQQIMSAQPDLIFVPLEQLFIASLYAELVTYDKPLTLLGSDTIQGKPEFRELFAPKLSKVHFIYPKHWNEILQGRIAQEYLRVHQRYCAQYEPSMVTAGAYDAIELLLSAIRSKPGARGVELIKTIRRLHFEGLTGAIAYGADGDPVKPLELFELKGNILTHWKRYE